MIGLPQRSVEIWRAAKAAGSTPDCVSLRNMADDIERDIASHERVAATIRHRATRKEFDAVFAAELDAAKTALAEIEAALPNALPPPYARHLER